MNKRYGQLDTLGTSRSFNVVIRGRLFLNFSSVVPLVPSFLVLIELSFGASVDVVLFLE